jgi:hypothetical protein
MINDEKVECKICGSQYKLGSLGIHISSKHKETNLKEYYLKYIGPGQDGLCKFCGTNQANFLGLTRGFRNNCSDPVCYNKSINPFSKEYKMKVDGLTDLEFERWKSDETERLRKITTDGFERARQNNPNFDKENSRYCKEFWMKKGFSEEESVKLAYAETDKNRKKLGDIRKDDPDYQKGKSWPSYKYWMKKGMTENEAKKHVKTLQSTFTIDKCIEKYGEENGKKRWQERQDKWLNTLDSKSEEEKLEILRKKVFHNRVYSKISVDLFEKIDLLDPELKLHTRYATKEGGELQLELPNNILLKPDLVFKNKIIEFYGDYWHCNPNIFESTKIVRRGSKKYRASSIWKIDSWRERILKEAGYDVKIVWENEFKEDPEKIINECYNYLKDDDNKG